MAFLQLKEFGVFDKEVCENNDRHASVIVFDKEVCENNDRHASEITTFNFNKTTYEKDTIPISNANLIKKETFSCIIERNSDLYKPTKIICYNCSDDFIINSIELNKE
jgi:hypothetical protein